MEGRNFECESALSWPLFSMESRLVLPQNYKKMISSWTSCYFVKKWYKNSTNPWKTFLSSRFENLTNINKRGGSNKVQEMGNFSKINKRIPLHLEIYINYQKFLTLNFGQKKSVFRTNISNKITLKLSLFSP